MRTDVSVGLVGYGYWGPHLARNLTGIPGARLCAVCDTSPERLMRCRVNQPDAVLFGEFRAMLRMDGLAAVVIATPARTHHALARAALRAGKHVLVEKPLASSVADCEDLVRLAAELRLVLMAAHTCVYSEAAREIFRIISSREIGGIRHIDCQRLNLGIFREDINVAWDLAPHDLSVILRVMGGLPETVNCQGNAHVHPGIEDVACISMEFPGGRFATVRNSWLEPCKVRRMTFVGSHGMIVHDDTQPDGKVRIYDTRVECPDHRAGFPASMYSYHYGECRIPTLWHREPLRNMCSHFIDCIRRGARPDSGGRQGADVVRVLEACTLSLRGHGRPVSLKTAS
jgi:predicted dehydrogenase